VPFGGQRGWCWREVCCALSVTTALVLSVLPLVGCMITMSTIKKQHKTKEKEKATTKSGRHKKKTTERR
jgi:hypothetical protein